MTSVLVRRDSEMRQATLIGVACGLGARDRRCAEGPFALHGAGLTTRLAAEGLRTRWDDVLEPPAEPANVAAAIADLARRLAQRVGVALTRGQRFAVVGGDHSCAVGTWSGAANHFSDRGRIGLVWVDAHMDSHTPETTPSGAYHGMPLACLLGHGDAALTGLTRGDSALAPGHVCLVGVRSYEPAELELLDRLGVRVFFAEEVARRGIGAVMREAMSIACDRTVGAGLSIDLDVIDPSHAPGVGCPVPGGLDGDALIEAIRATSRDPHVIGCEVVEYTPALDRDGQTAALAMALVAAALGGARNDLCRGW